MTQVVTLSPTTGRCLPGLQGSLAAKRGPALLLVLSVSRDATCHEDLAELCSWCCVMRWLLVIATLSKTTAHSLLLQYLRVATMLVNRLAAAATKDRSHLPSERESSVAVQAFEGWKDVGIAVSALSDTYLEQTRHNISIEHFIPRIYTLESPGVAHSPTPGTP